MEREPLWGNDLQAGPLGLSSWKALQVAEQRQKTGSGLERWGREGGLALLLPTRHGWP